MRYIALFLLLFALPAYADTLLGDRNGVTVAVPVGTTSGTVAAGDHGHAAGAVGAATAAQGAKADSHDKVIYPCAVAADATTDDAATLNACISAASSAGGGVVQLPYGKIVGIKSRIYLKSYVTLDLNTATIRWTGTAGGVMIDTPTDGWPVAHAGMENGFLDPRDNVVTMVNLDSVRYMHISDVYAVSHNTNMTYLNVTATNRHPFTDGSFATSHLRIERFGASRIYDKQTFYKDYKALNGVVFSGTNTISGAVRSVSINNAGTGYTIGDIVTISGGGGDAKAYVAATGGSGEVAFLTVYDHGTGGYSTANGVAVTGGTGTGLTLNISGVDVTKVVTNAVVQDSQFNVTGTGLNFVNHADNIRFAGQTTIGLHGSTGTAVIMNSEGDGTSWNGVNNNIFDHLTLWVSENTAGKKGIVLNRSESTVVHFLSVDPGTYWNVAGNDIFTDNYSRSHYVRLLSAGQTWGQKVLQKGTGTYFSPPSVYPGYKTLLQADATATADNTVTLPKSTGTLALLSDIPASTANLTVRDEDGNPSGQPSTLKFPNGSLTDNGDGSYSVSVSGGVTSVSSANTDISVANGNTTPTLTLNSSTTGGANKIPKLSSNGTMELAAADTSIQSIVRNSNSTASRYPKIKIFNHNGAIGGNFWGDPGISTHNYGGSWGNYLYTESGRSIGSWMAYGRGNDANTANESQKQGGSITFSTEANFTDANQPTRFSVALGTTGGNGNLTERLRIASDGTVSLGAASGGTATIQSTSHATKGLLTIANDTAVTGNLNVANFIISGYEEKTASYTVSKDSSKITLASGTATATLPKNLPAGQTSVMVVVAGAAASGVSFAAETGGSLSWGDIGVPTFVNNKRARVVCVSDNTAATTTAAWDCVKGGDF